MVKYCVVNKDGIGKTGAYAIFDGWLFETPEQAEAAMESEAYFRKNRGKYAVAKVEYEE